MPSADKQGVAQSDHVLRDALPFEARLQIGELSLFNRSRALQVNEDAVGEEEGRRVLDAEPLQSIRLRIPTQSGRGFRFDVGHRSDLIPATIPK